MYFYYHSSSYYYFGISVIFGIFDTGKWCNNGDGIINLKKKKKKLIDNFYIIFYYSLKINQ